MTDNKIIKLLNACDVSHIKIQCVESICSDTRGTTHFDLSGIVDLINRQKAEIESKNDLIHRQSDVISEQKEKLGSIYSEAVKEFAERLCEDRVSNDPVVIAVKAELKEMVGENNG